MNIELRQKKRAIRQYLRSAYSDERLAWLLAHARSGKLVYQSCCCLVGVATSDHALQGKADVNQPAAAHYHLAKKFVGAREAEQSYWELGYRGQPRSLLSSDELRRRRLVPMIQAELRQRAAVKRVSAQEDEFARDESAAERRDWLA
ncbi:MAG: hypothetical protein ACRD4Q_05590 [Candidatus Acidiferrales bacterium]